MITIVMFLSNTNFDFSFLLCCVVINGNQNTILSTTENLSTKRTVPFALNFQTMLTKIYLCRSGFKTVERNGASKRKLGLKRILITLILELQEEHHHHLQSHLCLTHSLNWVLGSENLLMLIPWHLLGETFSFRSVAFKNRNRAKT